MEDGRFAFHSIVCPACNHAPMLQDNVMELIKLLLTGYQFSSVKIPIEYVAVLRGARLAVLYQLDCGRGLDTGVVALVKQKVIH